MRILTYGKKYLKIHNTKALHFELTLDDKEYQGHFKDGEVNWFQMQPDQENHEMSLEELDAEVKRRIVGIKGDPGEL